MFKKSVLILITVLISVTCCIGFAAVNEERALFDKANDYLAVGQEEFAIMSFRELTRDYPNSIYCDEATFRLGEYHYKNNNPKEALKTFDQHSRLYPDSPFKERTSEYLQKLNAVVLIKKANELYFDKKWEEALAIYTQLVDDNTQEGAFFKEKIEKCKWKIAQQKEEAEKRKARIESGSYEAEILAQEIQNGKAQSSVQVIKPKTGTASSLRDVFVQTTSVMSGKSPLDSQMKTMERKFNLSMRSNDGKVPAAVLAFMGPLALVILSMMLILYVYSAFCLQTIARKTDTEGSWLAWIPIFNIILMLDIARKPKWWFFLLFLTVIPIIGSIIVLVLFVIIWMNICDQCGKPKWLGVLTIIPLVSFILLGYLAFSRGKTINIKMKEQDKGKEKDTEKVEDIPPPPPPIRF